MQSRANNTTQKRRALTTVFMPTTSIIARENTRDLTIDSANPMHLPTQHHRPIGRMGWVRSLEARGSSAQPVHERESNNGATGFANERDRELSKKGRR